MKEKEEAERKMIIAYQQKQLELLKLEDIEENQNITINIEDRPKFSKFLTMRKAPSKIANGSNTNRGGNTPRTNKTGG